MEYQTQQIGNATITVLVDPNAPPPGPVIPQVVTMRQARLALLAVGLLDDVEAAVQATDKATQIEWEYAQDVNRNWPTLAALAGALGLTSDELDALFAAAAGM